MSLRVLGVVTLLLLGACHARRAAAPSLDVDADQRNETAAKTLIDLDAADRAAGALPARAAPPGR